MKKITVYQCEKCESRYADRADAVYCEQKEITQDKGAKIDDLVMVLNGDGEGEVGKVTYRNVLNVGYAGERYWHTVAVMAKLSGGGSRFLCFNDYEMFQPCKVHEVTEGSDKCKRCGEVYIHGAKSSK